MDGWVDELSNKSRSSVPITHRSISISRKSMSNRQISTTVPKEKFIMIMLT